MKEKLLEEMSKILIYVFQKVNIRNKEIYKALCMKAYSF